MGSTFYYGRKAFFFRFGGVVDLYKAGLIYRGFRMVNWDPQAKTTVSDEEVNYKDKPKLYYVNYKVRKS